MFVEEDQVPIIPARLRHGLVGIVENGGRKGHIVPLDARNLASFAADAGGGVNQFANDVLALGAFARDRSGVAGNFLDAQRSLAHGAALLNFLHLHQEALEFRREGVGIDNRW